ncbi:type I-C CRISPR-associated protein Cas8c/Csd1 [Halalkalibacter oceani]|uniref:type I-C CRISPR-associated protein Cas8c/Csd1 n=1 Tax=Halalkalibacter oceani TaxID=1653776 RepID=UPI00339586F2
MTFLMELYKTYDENIDQVGVFKKNKYNSEYTLLPISHITQTAHVEVTIDQEGNFHSATIIPSQDRLTIIPCTQESASRSSGSAPHGLHDNLMYIAGDLAQYTEEFNNKEQYSTYLKQLRQWIKSGFATKHVEATYAYVKESSLINDLVKSKLLHLDENGQLINKWERKHSSLISEKSPLYSQVEIPNINKVFVRFNVLGLEFPWRDKSLFSSFIEFYNTQLGKDDICYITGETLPKTRMHPRGIRGSGDRAKIISSSNTKSIRLFGIADQAYNVSYEASQKCHNALKWLIQQQGYVIDGRVFLFWSVDGRGLPTLFDNGFDLLNKECTIEDIKSHLQSLKEENIIVNVLIMDSATIGRMSILNYKHMSLNDYLDALISYHTYYKGEYSTWSNNEGKYVKYEGAPSINDIVEVAYGKSADDKIIKDELTRLTVTILNGKRITRSLQKMIVNKASNPIILSEQEREKAWGVANALVEKSH